MELCAPQELPSPAPALGARQVHRENVCSSKLLACAYTVDKVSLEAVKPDNKVNDTELVLK